jgi:hypothetical protein
LDFNLERPAPVQNFGTISVRLDEVAALPRRSSKTASVAVVERRRRLSSEDDFPPRDFWQSVLDLACASNVFYPLHFEPRGCMVVECMKSSVRNIFQK